jgi:acetate kinase
VTSILVVNAGSTSLKLSAVDEDERSQSVTSFDAVPASVVAVGHRVVHGGDRFRAPLVIDRDVERGLEQLTELAPLHNRPAIAGIDAARTALPGLTHVAVFDTAFHATLPDEAATYALPSRLREQLGIRRYGFHGLSVHWAAERVPVARLIVCHLGGGCSVTAVRDGRSVDTTMGFTPLEGVPMATRSGSVDPGALLYLLRHGSTAEELDRILEHESGLLGLSGISSSVAELEQSDEPGARRALELYAYRIATAVGAMAAALDGVDALVFTAGVGEHSEWVRRRICDRLGFIGVELDPELNENAQPDAELAAPGSRARVVALHAREDVVVAREVRSLLARQARRDPSR